MNLEQLNTIDDVRHFLDGTQAVAFNVATNKQERYLWVQKVLVKHRYILLGKLDKGLITRYLMKVTGYSRAQMKRLISQYVKAGKVTLKLSRSNGFKSTHTAADVRLLARMDELHGQPSGAVLKKLCEHAYVKFNITGYARLATISVSHLYNLRASKTYQRQRCTLTKTSPKKRPLVSEPNRNPTNNQGIFVLILYIKGIKISTRACTTSTPLMKSRKWKWWFGSPHHRGAHDSSVAKNAGHFSF